MRFDSPKVHQYASDAYAWLHHAPRAARHSRAVIDWAGDPAARTWNPTRTATARTYLGVRAAELDDEIRRRWPDEATARAFHERVAAAKATLGTA